MSPAPARGLLTLSITLLTLGCGGASRPVVTPKAPPLGAPAGLAVWAVIHPAALDRALTAFDERVGDQTALGVFGAAWRQARAAFEDRLADLAPAGDRAADGWAAWGLDRDAPLRIGLAAPDGAELGRALLGALTGHRIPTPGRAVWRLRIVGRVISERRLWAGVQQAAGRVGLEVLPRTADDPAGWRARDPTGLRLALTVHHTAAGAEAALDVALPSRPDGAAEPETPVDPLAVEEIPWPETPTAPLAGGVRPAAVAAWESALQAARALALTAEVPRDEATAVLRAAAEVLSGCVTRWHRAAIHAEAIVATLDAPDGRPRLMAEVQLTPAGQAAWRASGGVAPLVTLDGLPAAIQVTADPLAFDRGLSPDWPDVLACAAGHPAVVGLVALAIAPGLAHPRRLPVPGPVAGWPNRSRGIAAALTGVVAVEEQAVPTLAGLVRVGPAHPIDPAPLGPDTARPTAEIHARPGPMPVTYGDHQSGDGRALIFGLGPGAHQALIDRLATTPERDPSPRIAGRLDPLALADALAAAGESGAGVEALRALGQRFGRLRLAAIYDGPTVRWTLDLEPASPDAPGAGRELDRAPASQ